MIVKEYYLTRFDGIDLRRIKDNDEIEEEVSYA